MRSQILMKYLKNRFMVKSTGVYLKSYYHVLLQAIDPSSLLFDQYLAPSIDDLNTNEDEKGESREQISDSICILEYHDFNLIYRFYVKTRNKV
jgi:hypothetical protein